ncbi:hypothetical protein KOR42_33760 [Thalassoglobus neptunius]|uniref:Uncharacterized protein n=1 Tax=Thalassoglobus neptunius TaxID=1938619 RepID=A0A5C5WM55_9PLAN|nr:hypothetical protein [Thalassoglobus neptunius]TWT51690.1 hypothetical protein KOR42_33760 [Thalassoglobus neptunius]
MKFELCKKNGVIFAVMLAISGCAKNSPTETDKSDTTPPHSEHDHGTEGPHHGSLIELGSGHYHAELVHDDQSVTIYILDGKAVNSYPIEATDLTINMKIDGKPEQFSLPAVPDTDDPTGKSSRFEIQDPKLAASLDEDAAEPRLVVTIDGKPYRGVITHSHDDDHDHDHDHH